jgi:hypothetical protein
MKTDVGNLALGMLSLLLVLALLNLKKEIYMGVDD